MRPELEEAVGLLQRGDESSIGRALELLQDTVFSFSMRVCRQREDAEDTTQEVLLKFRTEQAARVRVSWDAMRINIHFFLSS